MTRLGPNLRTLFQAKICSETSPRQRRLPKQSRRLSPGSGPCAIPALQSACALTTCKLMIETIRSRELPNRSRRRGRLGRYRMPATISTLKFSSPVEVYPRQPRPVKRLRVDWLILRLPIRVTFGIIRVKSGIDAADPGGNFCPTCSERVRRFTASRKP
jgi:hypothetical protein